MGPAERGPAASGRGRADRGRRARRSGSGVLLGIPGLLDPQRDRPWRGPATSGAIRGRHLLEERDLGPGPDRRRPHRSGAAALAELHHPGLDRRSRGRRDCPSPPGKRRRLARAAEPPPARPVCQARHGRLDVIADGMGMVRYLPAGQRPGHRRLGDPSDGIPVLRRLGNHPPDRPPGLAVERPWARPDRRRAAGGRLPRLGRDLDGPARAADARVGPAATDSPDPRPRGQGTVVGRPTRRIRTRESEPPRHGRLRWLRRGPDCGEGHELQPARAGRWIHLRRFRRPE